MADYFKSAFNYFSGPNQTKTDNEFLGSRLAVGRLTLRVKRVVAEGGCGIVYEAQEENAGDVYCLKRILSYEKSSSDLALHEIRLLKQLNGHPNILQFYTAASISKEKCENSKEFLIVTELCKGGQLKDHLPIPRIESPLPVNTILQICYQITLAVQHMHKQCPSVIHRDIKIENLLLTDKFIIKLCDFGSATTTALIPDASWTSLQRATVQEELERFTTPMYRAPEMLDLYQNYPIGTAVDIWALGCILFYLTCTYHPFEDSAKLAILNANYNLSSASKDHTIFHSLIRQMLLIDPRQRPDISDVLGELSELAASRGLSVRDSIPLNEDLLKCRASSNVNTNQAVQENMRSEAKSPTIHIDDRLKCNQLPHPQLPTKLTTSSLHTVPSRPPAIVASALNRSKPSILSQQQVQSVGNMFGIIKDGAGNLFRNIKDASTKVLGSVSLTFNTNMDFQFLTTRVAVMAFPPVTGSDFLNDSSQIEEIQNILDTQFSDSYTVYNLSTRSFKSDNWFHGRICHQSFESHRAPPLKSLIELCVNASLWLKQKPNNICIIHCTDEKSSSALLACSLLCFCRLFDNASPAIQLFASKRGNPNLNSSQIRYIDYVAQLAHNRISPHPRPLNLISLSVAPIPTFNKSKNGCRPYVEIFEGKTLVFSNYSDYDNLRNYVLEDRKIEVLLNGLTVFGDFTVVVHHCRSSFAGRGKIASVKIAQFQIHTAFVEPTLSELIYFKSDLDHLDNSSGFAGFTSRYAESFHLTLEFMVSPNEKPRQGESLVYVWETLPPEDNRRPEFCVSSTNELKNILVDFGRFNRKWSKNESVLPEPSQDVDSLVNISQNSVESPSTEKVTSKDFPSHESADRFTGEFAESSSKSKVTGLTDLLGMDNILSDHGDVPTPNDIDDTCLINVSKTPTNADSFPDNTSFSFTDFLNLSEPVTITEPEGNDWEDTFSKAPASANVSTPLGVSTNPFDPFGTSSTDGELNLFTETAANQYQTSDSSTINTESINTNFFEHPHLSASASTINLDSNSSNIPMHSSSSYTSLSNNIDSGNTGDSNKQSDPFAHLSEIFNGKRSDNVTSVSDSNKIFHPTGSHANDSPIRQPKQDRDTLFSAFSNDHNSKENVSTYSQSAHNKYDRPHTPRSNFSCNNTGARPQVDKDAFSDLLGGFCSSQPSSLHDKQNKSVNQMRLEKSAMHTNPEVLKIMEWTEGKHRNARALLCSLHTILWEGVHWKQIGMADLITTAQVKRQYRNAARMIHPDKWMNTVHENMARLALIELNSAMTEFEKEAPNPLVNIKL